MKQYFEHYLIESNVKVAYAAYFLEREANQWWQWLRKTYKAQRRDIKWKKFMKELLKMFGPIDYVDFHETLSKINQTSFLKDYQK